jgi:shikimate kinase
MNITLIGMPGTGKSYIGEKLAETLTYKLIETDILLEAFFGQAIFLVLDNVSEDSFLKEQENILLTSTNIPQPFIVSPGGSVIYSERAMLHLKKVSKVIYLKNSLATILERVAKSPRKIIGMKGKTIEQLYEERSLLYEKWADGIVDAEQDVDSIVKDIKDKYMHTF